MNVTFACPQCDQTGRVEFATTDAAIECPSCQRASSIPEAAFVDGELRRCLVCPSTDLYVRKDFPPRLGVTIVVVGFAVSCFAWANYWIISTFVVLFVTGLIDLALYLSVPNALICYRCSALYRGCKGLERHGAFRLETHERYRQQAARLANRQAVGEAQSTPQ